MKLVERLVSFTANGISILTFGAAILGFVDLNAIPDLRTNNQNSALLIIGIISIAISYSTSTIIQERIEDNKTYAGHVVIFCALYIFMTSFVMIQIIEHSPSEEDIAIAGNVSFVSGLIYVMVHFGVYLGRISFPNGLTFFNLFFAAFTKGYWIMLGHLFVYLIMMLILYPMFVMSFGQT